MKSIHVDLPEKVAAELARLVETGWFHDEGEAVRAALVEFLAHRSAELQERFQHEDIQWGAAREAERPRVMRIVCDTGPLLHLAEADVRDLLTATGDIHIPPAVDLEMRGWEADWHARRPLWVHVTSLDPGPALEARSWQQAGLLHYGEAHAIALARQLQAHWFLTDDASARLLAQSWGLEVHGSLGLVLWSAAHRHLTRSEAESALDRLARSSLWISSSVLHAAKAALNQMNLDAAD